MVDSYKSITNPSVGEFKDRGSRFIAYAFRVDDEKQINDIVAQIRVEHHAARHCCYAWRLGVDDQVSRTNDDSEPSSTAGRPILGQITTYGLTHVLVVVVRYFGGTLLGVSGLINAYRSAAAEALSAAEVIEIVVEESICVEVDYEKLDYVMQIIKRRDLKFDAPQFQGQRCSLRIFVRQSLLKKIVEEFSKIEKLEII